MASTKDMAYDLLRLPEGDDLDLLMVGKSGNGKMSTGNAILGRKTFTSLGHGKTHQAGYSDINGRIVKVVDIIGFCHHHACSHTDQSVQVFTDALSKGIGQFPLGFNSIVFVLAYTKEVTKEEEQIFATLKQILGDDVIRNHAVCVVTEGDAFQKAEIDDVNENDDETKAEEDSYDKIASVFQKWCRNRPGFLGQVFEECDFRCVLFDNSCDPDPYSTFQKKQRIDLVKLVDRLEEKHTLFTLRSYSKSKNTSSDHSHDPHDHMAGECRLPIVLEEISRENSLIQEAIFKAKHDSQAESVDYSRIKDKSCHLLHEISHHEPEKLVILKPDLEGISEIAAECENLIDSTDGAHSEGRADEEKLNFILTRTESVKVKLGEIRDREEEYHSWISSSVTSPVKHLINTALPSVMGGLLEVADFVVDTIFD